MTQGISVLICTFNGKHRLKQTLKHLAKQKINPDLNCEIILVDNASTDGTSNFAQIFWQEQNTAIPLHIYQETKQGKKYALELGFQKIQYEYVIICDDDNWLEENYLQIAFDTMIQNDKIGVLGGKNEAIFETQEPFWFKQFEHTYAVGEYHYPNGNITDTRSRVFGAGMIFRKKIWDNLKEKGFKTLIEEKRRKNHLPTGTDTEMCWMAKLLGYEVHQNNNLQLKHFMTRSRLNWKYCRILQRGIGESLPYLGVYSYLWAKRQGKMSLSPEEYYNQTLREAKKMFYSSPKRLFRYYFKDIEGEFYMVNYEYARGKMIALRELKNNYTELIKQTEKYFI